MITKAGEYLVPALAVAAGIFVLFAAAIVGVVAAAAVVQVAIYSLVAAVVYVGVQIVQGVIGAWNAVTAYLDSITLAGVGTAIMQGLANGIASAAGLPLQAITGVVKGVISAAHSLLDINSPSKVFAEIGGSTAEGFADGVDDGAPEAQSALVRMADPAQARTGASASAGTGGGGGGKAGNNFSGATLNFTLNGVKDGEHAVSMIEEALTRLFEGDASQATGGAPA
ncbi:MAG: hypothetical protein WDO74_17045 [Pseudomonadota bacterium]